MAKYNWRRFLRRNEGVQIFHYARRMGKTQAIAEATRKDPDGIMVVMNEQNARLNRQRFPDLAGRIYCPEQITGWSPMNERHRGAPDVFHRYYYYIDEACHLNRDFLIVAYRQERLRALSFTDPSTTYDAREAEVWSHKEILQRIVDNNRKTYYHKFHDENSQLYRRITRFSTRAELMPGIM